MKKWVGLEGGMHLRGKQNLVGGRNSGTDFCQFSHFLADCRQLHQSSGVSPDLGEGPSCHARAEMGRGGAQNVSWNLGSGGWCSSAGEPISEIYIKLLYCYYMID